MSPKNRQNEVYNGALENILIQMKLTAIKKRKAQKKRSLRTV